MSRRKLVIIIAGGIVLGIISFFLAIWFFKPTAAVAPPPVPAPVKNLVKPPKKPLIVKAPSAPSLPERPVVIHNNNIQNVQPVQPVQSNQIDRLVNSLPPVIYNYNIQQTVTPESQPVPMPPPLICPKIGYYVLSHEPTTDRRQFDDHGYWNPGHMELVRECRNGTFHEFSRWIGHPLPGSK